MRCSRLLSSTMTPKDANSVVDLQTKTKKPFVVSDFTVDGEVNYNIHQFKEMADAKKFTSLCFSFKQFPLKNGVSD